MLYFGFGSNLDRDDLRRWCDERGHVDARPIARGRAWLPDHELVFHYYSRSRRGGALDVRERLGAAVPGVLFACDEPTWRARDHKEGGGVTYARRRVVVLDEAGEEQTAWTYRVTDAHRRAEHVPPTEAYVRTVERGLRAHALPTEALRAAAAGLDAPCFPTHLFAYGTLMRGEARADLLPSAGRRAATIAGALVSLGAYPGLVRGHGEVQGELVPLGDPAEAVAALDPYEDFVGYGSGESLYRRVVVQARAQDATVWAWTYRYLGGGGAPISGSWSGRRRF